MLTESAPVFSRRAGEEAERGMPPESNGLAGNRRGVKRRRSGRHTPSIRGPASAGVGVPLAVAALKQGRQGRRSKQSRQSGQSRRARGRPLRRL